jgi:predicted acylesterase/phospholipase RssA
MNIKNINENINNIVNQIIKPNNYNDINIPLYICNKNKKSILVLSGGGIKGISFIGALQALKEFDILNSIKIFAGTSIGSLILLLIVIGYLPNELYEFVKIFDFSKLNICDINILITKYGLNDGNIVIEILNNFLTKKNYNKDITFKELYDKTNKELIITTTNINKRCCEYLSYKNYPNLSVVMAVRMSISLPLIFTPVKYNNNLYVDGSCMDNLPIEIFKEQEKIIALYLDDDIDEQNEINSFELYGYSVLNSIMNQKIINKKNTITIYIKSINSANFNIDLNKKINLYEIGYNSVYKFKF